MSGDRRVIDAVSSPSDKFPSRTRSAVHGTDPKFVRITEVFSLQFFGGTGGTGGTPRDLMLQRWYQPVGPVFANFVFMVVRPVSPISTTIISIMCLQCPGTTGMPAMRHGR